VVTRAQPLVQIVVSTRFNQRRSSADPVVCYAPTGGGMTQAAPTTQGLRGLLSG
jgi:hypothetical protein